MLLTQLIEENAEKHPRKTALTMRMGYRTVSLTYKELFDNARKIACFLEKNGVSKGDKVLLLAPNSPYWISVFWGTILQGAIIVPLNVQMTKETIRKIARETEAKVFFKHLRSTVEVDEHIKVYDIELLGEETKDIDPSCYISQEIKEDDVMQILYTSGTTGDPKGVILTHKNFVSNLETLNQLIPISPSDRFLSILPLSHIFEQTVGFLLPFKNTAEIIYAHSPTAISELLKEHKITKMVAVPEFLSVVMARIETGVRERGTYTLFSALMGISKAIPVKPFRRFLFRTIHKQLGGKLKTVASGGAALDVELEKKWDALGITLIQGYGLTETSPIVSANTYKEHRLGTVGKVIPGVEVKLADDGEILVKGPSVFRGYFKDTEKTKAAFTEDGWFKTDDIGEMDKDGFLSIRGRKKYMIKGAGAQNVYPEDIEFELNKLEEVTDSCVIGIKKRSGIFEIHAVLLGEIEDPQSVVRSANENLASYQKITGWSVWPEDDFPRSATRKVRRKEVLTWLEKREEVPEKEVHVAKTPLIHLLSETTGISSALITPETKIVPDLNVDSLLRVELVARIEEKFGMHIDEVKINLETSVADVEDLIKTGEKPAEKIRFKKWTISWWARLNRTIHQIVWIFPITRIFVKLKVEGREHLKDLSLPAVFMPNHISHLDSLVLLVALPFHIQRKIAYAAARDVLYGEFRRRSLLAEILFNTFPFPRKEGEGVKEGLDYIGRLLDSNWSVVLYPEGKMSETRELLPLKKGAGLVAVEMDVPIVPVKIAGTQPIVPYAKLIPQRRGTVTVSFGKPLIFSKKDSYIEATEIIEKEIKKL